MPEKKAIAGLMALSPAGKPAVKRLLGWRTALFLCAIGLLVAAGMELTNVFLGRNFHEVVLGRVYRCSQPSNASLEQVAAAHGIRTVVNLRGCSAPLDWYLEESRATHQLNLAQEDVCLSAYRLPSVSEIHHLVDVLDHSEYPILLHCRRGADRTGLVSAAVFLLQTDMGLGWARYQLGLRYGHVALGRTAYLNRFFDLYGEWLAKKGFTHSRANFRRWLEHDYVPGKGQCSLEMLESPVRISCGEPFALQVRCHNTSAETWRLKPGSNAGIHAGFRLFDARDHQLIEGRGGLLDAEVPPGNSIDLTVVVPSIPMPGAYRVLLDMVDEGQQCWFYQLGSEPLEEMVNVVQCR